MDAITEHPDVQRLIIQLAKAQAKNKEQEEFIDRLCSQEPCPKCGYGVTGACYGCEIKKLREALDIIRKRSSIGFKLHQRKHKNAPELSLCVWCEVEQVLKDEK